MGASFRSIDEIIGLAGCDLLTISPNLLSQLQTNTGELIRRLDPAKAANLEIERISMDKASFDQMHAADRMASEKLSEGIKGVSKALEALEILLSKRLAQIEAGTTLSESAASLFQGYDLDGDGFITREEWLGTDRVFDALDNDQDGKITAEEMSIALGAILNIGVDPTVVSPDAI
jgi:transaldolase